MQDTPKSDASKARILLSLLAGVAVIWVFYAAASGQIADGRLIVSEFPADTTFVIDIILRIAAGQVPHVDFTLHLGALPYVLAAAVGGDTPVQGFLIAQTIFTGTCLLIGLWVWWTRLGLISGPLLLLFITVLGQTVSLPARNDMGLALFYNRWGWVLVLLFACLTLLPSRRDGGRAADGCLAGLVAFFMLTVKITFFVGLLPAVLLCVLLRRQYRELVFGAVTFLVLVCVVFAIEPAFWPGYFENMAWAAANPLRPNAGTELFTLVGSGWFLFYTVLFALFLLAAFRTGHRTDILWLTLAAIGFYFIQYQNFQSTPFWLMFLALYAMVQTGTAATRAVRRVWMALSAVTTVFAGLLLLPMGFGLMQFGARADNFPHAAFPLDGAIRTGAYLAPLAMQPIETEYNLTFETPAPYTESPECNLVNGWAGHLIEMAEDLRTLPGPAFVADSIAPHWYLVGADPLPGAALWNYGSVRGLENATFVVVPKCATKPDYKREILREIERSGVTLTPFRETERSVIYRKAR
jgi:hypothetical protein